MGEYKVCKKCKQNKLLSEFSSLKQAKDGKQNRCKACDKLATAAWYAKNQKVAIEKAKEWNQNNKIRRNIKVSEWRKVNADYVKSKDQERYKKHKEKIVEAAKQRYVGNKKRARGLKLRKYWPGSTWEEALANYEALFAKQGGCCAICGKSGTTAERDFDVDHNHTTGQVRGLLCGTCNRTIGLAKVDSGIDLLKKMIEYALSPTSGHAQIG